MRAIDVPSGSGGGQIISLLPRFFLEFSSRTILYPRRIDAITHRIGAHHRRERPSQQLATTKMTALAHRAECAALAISLVMVPQLAGAQQPLSKGQRYALSEVSDELTFCSVYTMMVGRCFGGPEMPRCQKTLRSQSSISTAQALF